MNSAVTPLQVSGFIATQKCFVYKIVQKETFLIGSAINLNGLGTYDVPYNPSIFGGFLGSSARKVNLWSKATVSMNSSILDNCSPGHARFPAMYDHLPFSFVPPKDAAFKQD